MLLARQSSACSLGRKPAARTPLRLGVRARVAAPLDTGRTVLKDERGFTLLPVGNLATAPNPGGGVPQARQQAGDQWGARPLGLAAAPRTHGGP
jgi:hypothetical protein